MGIKDNMKFSLKTLCFAPMVRYDLCFFPKIWQKDCSCRDKASCICGRCAFMLKTVKRTGLFVHSFYVVLVL